MSLSVLLFSAAAAAATGLSEAPQLDAAEQDRHDRLRSAFDTHFFPERVDAPVHLEHDHEHGPGGPRSGSAKLLFETGEGFACLTQLVAELKRDWHLFSAEERAEMTAILAPWKADLLDPEMVVSEDGSVPPPASPCNGYQYDNFIDGQYHSVQWEDGAITENRAEDFLESLDFSYEVEVEQQGWKAPNRITSYPMGVYVVSGGYAGAYTTVAECGSTWQPYVVAYAGGLAGGTWYKTMACHEFNHASQFSYGQAHEFWWWEATATYAEEYVYEDYNEWAEFVGTYGRTPHVGLNASAGNSDDQTLFYHTYAMAIWAFYLDQYWGGLDLVQDTWDLAYDRAFETRGYDYWMPDVIEDAGLDFEEVWTGYMATNAVMAYAERDEFPEAERTDIIDELPAEGDESSRYTPQSLGMAFVTFESDIGDEGDVLEVSINGENGPQWYAVLVRGEDEVEEVVAFDVDPEHARGSARITLDGRTDVHLVVSPVDEDAQGYTYRWDRADEYGFSWDAERIDAEDLEEAPPADDADEDEAGVACGCTAGPASVPLSAALLGLVVVARRRRD
jgi:hypothetical protein